MSIKIDGFRQDIFICPNPIQISTSFREKYLVQSIVVTLNSFVWAARSQTGHQSPALHLHRCAQLLLSISSWSRLYKEVFTVPENFRGWWPFFSSAQQFEDGVFYKRTHVLRNFVPSSWHNCQASWGHWKTDVIFFTKWRKNHSNTSFFIESENCLLCIKRISNQAIL